MRNKKVKGFTLIELIVVIAIIAVLAAILIPAMMGWISKSKWRTANSNAKSIFASANTITAEYVVNGTAVMVGTTAAEHDVVAVEGDTYNAVTSATYDTYSIANMRDLIGDDYAGAKGTAWTVRIDANGKVIGAIWAKTAADSFVGGHPIEFDEDFSGKPVIADAITVTVATP